VKLSALAVRLEKPFRLFICRDLALWFEDLQCGKHFNCRFEEVRVIFLARVEGWNVFLELGTAFFTHIAC
jgi:hypothetical protein